MSMDNQISESVEAAVKAAFIQKIGEARTLLTFLRNIPKDQKRKYSGIAKARAGLDEVCVRIMIEHPELVPVGISLAEVQKDIAFRKDCKDMNSPVLQLGESLTDTEMVGATDSMKAYRWLYAHIKECAKHNVAGADAIVAQLAPFFAQSGSSEGDDGTPPAAPAA